MRWGAREVGAESRGVRQLVRQRSASQQAVSQSVRAGTPASPHASDSPSQHPRPSIRPSAATKAPQAPPTPEPVPGRTPPHPPRHPSLLPSKPHRRKPEQFQAEAPPPARSNPADPRPPITKFHVQPRRFRKKSRPCPYHPRTALTQHHCLALAKLNYLSCWAVLDRRSAPRWASGIRRSAARPGPTAGKAVDELLVSGQNAR